MEIPQPHRKHSSCAYCGDAPVNHTFVYFMGLIALTVDAHILRVTKHAPQFLRKFVDWIFAFTFDTFIFFKLAKLSDDIDMAKTFRSRVVWEEAKKRGIDMRQLILFGKPVDQYKAKINGKNFYFDSLPIPEELLHMNKNWDDKFLLKEEFIKAQIPIPQFIQFASFLPHDTEKMFSKFAKPIIVKPRVGSRGRHTITNINTLAQFKHGINIAKQICSYLVAEEHLFGDVCRATFVSGKLMGFYRGATPFIIGDGVKTITELIIEKDNSRPDRVEKVLVNEELREHVSRVGFKFADILPSGMRLNLTHRTGRFYGGVTSEMLDVLHPSFIPILTKAAKLVGLPVIGFDCIVPEPTADANTQKWGIIECNTLPFIDLHYYALEGKPKNIAGAIWDMWNVPS